jgi:hypothetical protein
VRDPCACKTLRREPLEEACVVVLDTTLLEYARSRRVSGSQRGLVLVRSYWRADVLAKRRKPSHEVRHRRIVPAVQALDHVRDPTW